MAVSRRTHQVGVSTNEEAHGEKVGSMLSSPKSCQWWCVWMMKLFTHTHTLCLDTYRSPARTHKRQDDKKKKKKRGRAACLMCVSCSRRVSVRGKLPECRCANPNLYILPLTAESGFTLFGIDEQRLRCSDPIEKAPAAYSLICRFIQGARCCRDLCSAERSVNNNRGLEGLLRWESRESQMIPNERDVHTIGLESFKANRRHMLPRWWAGPGLQPDSFLVVTLVCKWLWGHFGFAVITV